MSISLLLLLVVSTQSAEPKSGEPVVVARVDGEPITAGEVDLELRRALGERQADEAKRRELGRAALAQVIDRRLVLRYLSRGSQAASDRDVDYALTQFEKDLAARDQTLAAYLQQAGISSEDFRRALAWQISWQRYLDQQLTDENLEKYFRRYQREFDGTELRVAQILLKLPPDANEAATNEALRRAAEIRAEIVRGKISFSAAASQHSEAPSAERGGDIGWIGRRQPMPDDFSKTAYSLRPGQVSEPFVTRFGVHLITVLEEKPGQRTWRDVEPELRKAVALYLFKWIAERERESAKIERMDGDQ